MMGVELAVQATEAAVVALRDLVESEESAGRSAHRLRVLLDEAMSVYAGAVAERWRHLDGADGAPTATTIARLRQTADDLERYWPDRSEPDA